MDENIVIELNESKSQSADATQLPTNFLAFGEIENDDIKVYIKQDVYKALEKYALEDTTCERGTIILGNYCQEMNKTHVVISNYIEAKYTDASASTLTFTHETWDYIHKEHDRKYSDKKIVGWQHTHPSYGIFLSNYDLFIHENFFNLPFQVAYVIDPIQNLRGFFQWKNGKIEKLKGYYVYDEIGIPIKISQTKPKERGEVTLPKNKSHLPTFLSTVCAVLLAVLCLFLFSSLRKQSAEQQKMQQTISTIIEEQNSQKALIEIQQQTIEALTVNIENDYSNTKESDFIIYTIKDGDTLETICTSLNIAYYENKNIILGLNNISDENVIIAGENIIIPKSIQKATES